jgi:hypothetical protein
MQPECEGYVAYDVPISFTLSADEIVYCDGNIVELLVRAGIAVRVNP